MGKSNKAAVADYAKKMKDIKLRVPYTPGKFDNNGNPISDHYEKIKAAAERHNMKSINEYILYLIILRHSQYIDSVYKNCDYIGKQ